MRAPARRRRRRRAVRPASIRSPGIRRRIPSRGCGLAPARPAGLPWVRVMGLSISSAAPRNAADQQADHGNQRLHHCDASTLVTSVMRPRVDAVGGYSLASSQFSSYVPCRSANSSVPPRTWPAPPGAGPAVIRQSRALGPESAAHPAPARVSHRRHSGRARVDATSRLFACVMKSVPRLGSSSIQSRSLDRQLRRGCSGGWCCGSRGQSHCRPCRAAGRPRRRHRLPSPCLSITTPPALTNGPDALAASGWRRSCGHWIVKDSSRPPSGMTLMLERIALMLGQRKYAGHQDDQHHAGKN